MHECVCFHAARVPCVEIASQELLGQVGSRRKGSISKGDVTQTSRAPPAPPRLCAVPHSLAVSVAHIREMSGVVPGVQVNTVGDSALLALQWERQVGQWGAGGGIDLAGRAECQRESHEVTGQGTADRGSGLRLSRSQLEAVRGGGQSDTGVSGQRWPSPLAPPGGLRVVLPDLLGGGGRREGTVSASHRYTPCFLQQPHPWATLGPNALKMHE